LDDDAITLKLAVLFVGEWGEDLFEGIIIMDELFLIRTLFVPLLIPVVDLIAAEVDTDITVIDTTTNVIINISGVLSNVKG
jgi:hypothetical protein